VSTFYVTILVLVLGIASLIRSRRMRKSIPVDKNLPVRKAVAEHRLDQACAQTVILLKKVEHSK
jgi:hypothetical protein